MASSFSLPPSSDFTLDFFLLWFCYIFKFVAIGIGKSLAEGRISRAYPCTREVEK
jgi:hypothetical protein